MALSDVTITERGGGRAVSLALAQLSLNWEVNRAGLLSGRADADEFHLDAGRLCVMTSRHSVACFLFTRGGIEDMLLRHAPSGDRVLGSNEDVEFEGWLAHLSVLRGLRERSRVVTP